MPSHVDAAGTEANGNEMNFEVSSSSGFRAPKEPNLTPTTPIYSGPKIAEARAQAPVGSTASHTQLASTYQVYFNMICTNAQLEALMSNLAGAGTIVTMKIDLEL